MNSIIYQTLDNKNLNDWFEHLQKIFEWTPKQYFIDHWNNDPYKDINGFFIKKKII